MEINLSPELRAKLERLAAQQDRDSDSLVQEAVERLVGYDEWFIREVEKGLAQVERGEVLEHEEVGAYGKAASRLMQVRWTTAAADDLETIADYLFEKTPANAARLIREIRSYRIMARLRKAASRLRSHAHR